MIPLLLLFATNLDFVSHLGGRIETDKSGRPIAVHLRGAWVTDTDLDAIAATPTIERLDFSLTRLSDQGLQRLKAMPNVKELNLLFAEFITDEGLAAMRTWTKIERVNARGTKVTDNTLALLASTNKTSLKALDIGYAEVTDSGLQNLPKLKGLKELAFGGNKMTEVGLEVLRAMPQLTKLDIAGKQRTDSGLWFVGITDLGLEPVVTLTELRELNVSGTTISSKGVAKLQTLKKLEKLNLNGVKRVTDESVEYLAAMSSLKWVDLKDTGVTTTGFTKLRAARPGLIIGGDPSKEPHEPYKVEFENREVRVVRASYGPREKSDMHEHPDNPAVVYIYLNDAGPMSFKHEDGRFLTRRPVKAGQIRVAHGGKEIHQVENMSDGVSNFIRVELRTKQPDKLEKDQRIDPVTPTAADKWAKAMFENTQVRVTRLACYSRANCPANDFNALDVQLPSGANAYLRKGAPARFNEDPLPLDLVRIELKTTP